MMCQKGEEQYSEPEIVYYGGEACCEWRLRKVALPLPLQIEELNQTLDERKQERAQRACAQESPFRCAAPNSA